jgi:hypothetical protein
MTHVVSIARGADRLAEGNRVAEMSRGTLGWYDFLARHFPGRGRHDFDALTAYGAYRSSASTVRPKADALEQPQPDPSDATLEDACEEEIGLERALAAVRDDVDQESGAGSATRLDDGWRISLPLVEKLRRACFGVRAAATRSPLAR